MPDRRFGVAHLRQNEAAFSVLFLVDQVDAAVLGNAANLSAIPRAYVLENSQIKLVHCLIVSGSMDSVLLYRCRK